MMGDDHVMSVCLCMIVKNEAAVLERCIASVRGLIDSWSICDTGSTDGTPELAQELLGDLPGELHRRPWVDFGHNRTEALRLAGRRSGYLLLLDADMTVEYDPGCTDELDASSYLLRYEGDLEYWQKLLVRSDYAWRYVGSTHEYIMSPDTSEERRLESIVVHHHEDGASRAGKFMRDLELLERDLRRDPRDVRTLFYVAQTLRDLGHTSTAIELYELRAELGGWNEEVYYALYQAGALRAAQGDWESGLATLLRAWELRPARVEALYSAVALLREHGLHHAAHGLVCIGLGLPRPPDTLFLERWVYEWGFLFEYSITAYWTGDPQGALDACNRLLARGDLPEHYRRQTIANREFCITAVSPTLTPASTAL
jgi:tetratricopeptide (TPR) repeat protein